MAIINLDLYKTYKNINSVANDDRHTLIIDAVNTFIENYCGRVFTAVIDEVEYFNSDETEIYPKVYPLTSVSSLEYSTDAGETYATELVEYTDYVVDLQQDRLIALNKYFKDQLVNINALKLTYAGGYDSIPTDLEQAAVHLVDHYFDEDYIPRKFLAGASKDVVVQADLTQRLPPHIRRVFESYRNIVM